MRAALVLPLVFCACQRGLPPAGVSQVVLATDDKSPRILRGIFSGEGGWRYTGPTFAFSLDRPAPGKPVFLEVDLDVPEELNSSVMVVAKVNGAEVVKRSLTKGRQFLAAPVAESALAKLPAEIEISADKTFHDGGAGHVYSLIVFSAGLKQFEETAEFRDRELAKSRQAYEEVLKQRNLKLPVEKQKEIMRLFHELPVWESMWFQNVRIIKNPMDLWMLQQTAYETRPEFVVETGTWQGGSALWWAHTLSGMGLEQSRVFTVDIQDLTKTASAHPLWKRQVEFLHGSSTDPKIVGKIAERVKGKRVLVNLDSDHSMKHVLNELRLYAPMVGPGGYIAVEDTHLDGIPTHPEQGPGPTAAIRQFLAEPEGKDFEQDFSREALIMTSYPGGWLRRKK